MRRHLQPAWSGRTGTYATSLDYSKGDVKDTLACHEVNGALTSNPQRFVRKHFFRKATVPLLLSVAPSSRPDGTSSATASPICRRGTLRQLLPSSHSAASVGRVNPPKNGRGSAFLDADAEATAQAWLHPTSCCCAHKCNAALS